MVMTDLDPDLLRRVLEDPHNDDPRLLAADWWDDRGESERAEFIRVQCRLAATPRFVGECGVCGNTPDEAGIITHGRGCYVTDEDGGGCSTVDDNPEWVELGNRERVLVCRYVHDRGPWNQSFLAALDLHPFRDDFVGQWYWRRGFISDVELTADKFLAPGFVGKLFAEAPVTGVTLTNLEPLGLADDPYYHWYGSNLPRSLPPPPASFVVPAPLSLGWAHQTRSFRSRAGAMKFLSYLCVSYGRRKAGLPMLPEHADLPERSAPESESH